MIAWLNSWSPVLGAVVARYAPAAESPKNASPHAPVDEVEHRRCNKHGYAQNKNLVKTEQDKPHHVPALPSCEIFCHSPKNVKEQA